MRIQKPTERWFVVPGDPDKAEIKIKTLTPKERFDIYDAAFKQELAYEPGEDRPRIRQTTDKTADRLLTAKTAVVDWKHVFDKNDKLMKCTPENVVAAVEGIEGFMSFIRECMQKLDDDLAEEKKDQEKKLANRIARLVEKPDCELCKKVKAQNNKKPDCNACLGYLQPENELPMKLFWRLKGQLIMGMNGPVDMRVDILRSEITRHITDPTDQDYCLDLLQAGFAGYMDAIKKQQGSQK